MVLRPPESTLFAYTTLFRSGSVHTRVVTAVVGGERLRRGLGGTSELLRRGVRSLALLAQERRTDERRTNLHEQHHNQKLDQGKTTLITRALAQSIQHLNTP